MENSMMLHQNTVLFKSALKETADYFNIRDFFVEKDYWISLVLKRLSESKYVDSVVFKGGTSLSKGYNLINRFSEDIDIAIINTDSTFSGNKIKNLIRTIEKEIAQDLIESEIKGLTSKGSKFRKSVYRYHKAEETTTLKNTLIIEINSFANPFPFHKIDIQSIIGEFLQSQNQNELIKKYDLEAFSINVLDKEQTFIEKLVSLIRFSFADNYTEELSGKIRHFYDLYFLMNDNSCSAFLESNRFAKEFNALLVHDQETFNEPIGWSSKKITESPLLTKFEEIWNALKYQYTSELSILAFSDIPTEGEISKKFKEILSGLKNLHD